jgi:hypothetical protein
MLAFSFAVFAVGAALVHFCTFRQFAVGSLVVVAAGFGYAIYLGVGPGWGMLGAAYLFSCGQVGYVFGIAVSALVSSKQIRRIETAKRADESEKYGGAGSRPVENGHGPFAN